MQKRHLKFLGWLCFVLGFGSILLSIATWYRTGGAAIDPLAVAHAERFGLFIGLWAPTFFILSNRFDRAAESTSRDLPR